jgi:hypothetical protein
MGQCASLGGHDPVSGLAAFIEFCPRFYALYKLIVETCGTKSASFRHFFDLTPFSFAEKETRSSLKSGQPTRKTL